MKAARKTKLGKTIGNDHDEKYTSGQNKRKWL